MKFSIIIPVYGQWELTKNCLLSLKDCIKEEFEILFIDNGAKALADCKASIEAPILGKSLFGENFIYLGQEENLNFAKACNLGAKLAKNDLLFFLNSDTQILENTVEPLLEAMNDPRVMKIAAPLLLYPPSQGKELSIQHLGISITPRFEAVHLYEHFPANHPLVHKKRDLQAITAAAIFIYKEHFLKLNGFDEDFINGFEDLDFCARFRNAGGELEIVPHSKMIHHCSQSIGRGKNNDHNTAILAQKEGGKSLKPDFEKLINNDAYVLKLDPLCELVPYPNSELEERLEAILLSNKLDLLLNMHLKEPYWHQGLAAIVKHEQMSNIDKARYIHKASYIYVEPLVFIDYIKITASLMPLKIEEMNGILSEKFAYSIDIDKKIAEQQDFSAHLLERLENFKQNDFISDEIIENAQYHIDNMPKFLEELEEAFEILKSLAK